MKKQPPPKSHRSVRDFLAELEGQNKTLAVWARENKFPLQSVYGVANGNLTGRRGTAREVLTRMGVAAPPMFAAAPAATTSA